MHIISCPSCVHSSPSHAHSCPSHAHSCPSHACFCPSYVQYILPLSMHILALPMHILCFLCSPTFSALFFVNCAVKFGLQTVPRWLKRNPFMLRFAQRTMQCSDILSLALKSPPFTQHAHTHAYTLTHTHTHTGIADGWPVDGRHRTRFTDYSQAVQGQSLQSPYVSNVLPSSTFSLQKYLAPGVTTCSCLMF